MLFKPYETNQIPSTEARWGQNISLHLMKNQMEDQLVASNEIVSSLYIEYLVHFRYPKKIFKISVSELAIMESFCVYLVCIFY